MTSLAPRSRTNSPNTPVWGFTLVEMLVVVVVLALVAATVGTKWASVHHRAVRESALQRLENMDAQMRRFARTRGQQCNLTFDLDRHVISKEYPADDAANPSPETLATGIRLKRVQVGSERSGQQISTVRFDVRGQSPTYGVHLAGPGKSETWLIFAGVSGQMTDLGSEAAWNESLQLLEPPRL